MAPIPQHSRGTFVEMPRSMEIAIGKERVTFGTCDNPSNPSWFSALSLLAQWFALAEYMLLTEIGSTLVNDESRNRGAIDIVVVCDASSDAPQRRKDVTEITKSANREEEHRREPVTYTTGYP